jgi:hypothetical protein
MVKKASSRNSFIKQRPDKALLLEYFSKLAFNRNMYVIAYEKGDSGVIIHEATPEGYLYRVFLDKTEASIYASYYSAKNKVDFQSLTCLPATYNEIRAFAVELEKKNFGQKIKISAYVMLNDILTEIDIVWTNNEKFMV